MARKVIIRRFGGPEVLELVDADPGTPRPHEVLVRVKAIGLNRADILMRQGTYIERPSLPTGLGLEASGIVEKVGEEVRHVSAGDLVSVIPAISMQRRPTYGEVMIFDGQNVVPNPPGLGLVEAAALWMAYLTAYGALVEVGGLLPGERVLISAASSSVGIAAIQIANRVGAVPIATTRTHEKINALRDLGASLVIASDDDAWTGQLAEASGPDGFRVAFDAIGGPQLADLLEVMSPGGLVLEYGGLSGASAALPANILLRKSLTLRGYVVHELVQNRALLERAKSFILGGLGDGTLRPLICQTFPFDEVKRAHAFVEEGEQIGKVVLQL